MKVNDKLKNKTVARLIASGITLSTIPFILNGCGKEKAKILTDEYTISELLNNETIAKNTKLDELENNRQLLFKKNMTYVEAADLLIKYMDRVEEFQVLNLHKNVMFDELGEEDKKDTLTYTDNNIDYLIDVATNSDECYTDEEMNIASLKLMYLRDYYKKWINKNGSIISIEIMNEAIKGSLAQDLKMDEKDYFSIKFRSRQKNNGQDCGSIIAKDKVFDFVEADDDINKAASFINYLQVVEGLNDKNKFEMYRESIDYAKNIIIKGISTDNDELETKYSNEKANKILIKK